MANLVVNGGKPLSGTVVPSGNKNAALPILCASLLTDEKVVMRNVPNITDIEKLVRFFRALGSQIDWDRKGKVLEVCHAQFAGDLATVGLPQGMRSSVLLFAPLLRRVKRVPLHFNTKGCTLGVRELDPHLEMLSGLGTDIIENGGLALELKGNFRGGRFWQDYMSVTTTENFAMAATLADGTSTMINAASEPHVQDLCYFLQAMGANIDGIGSSVLKIEGVDKLGGADVTIASDHHEITTFLALGAITGGQVRVEKALPHHFDLIVRSFAKLGIVVEFDGDTALVAGGQELVVEEPYTTNLLPKIEAAPWPYFPVDLLPPLVALAARAKGVMHFWNKVYEGGFAWIPELLKFGAHAVMSDPHRIIVFGDKPMRPAEVEAPYIVRVAVALYMMAASIEGKSIVKNADPIRRAHPYFVENLKNLGAEVEWDS